MNEPITPKPSTSKVSRRTPAGGTATRDSAEATTGTSPSSPLPPSRRRPTGSAGKDSTKALGDKHQSSRGGRDDQGQQHYGRDKHGANPR